jgi:pilus assembly protein CpaC
MTSNRTQPGLRTLLGALLATTATFSAIGTNVAAQPYAQQGAVQDVVADSSGYGGQLAVPMGGSRILRFTRPIGQVMVGNPKVGDVIPLGERTLYVLGKAQGGTSLTVMPRGGGAPLATLDLRVGYDVDNIRRAMRQVLPGEMLDASAQGDGLVLTGVLTSSAAAARAASIAEQYAPGHVVNLTSIRAAEQVMLSVRVAEVQRSALQQLGLNNLNALWDKTGALALAAPVLNTDAVVNLLGRSTSGDWTLQGLFDALEKKGFASTLAEPNLVALSGETAVFFAGGEFPIPVPQTGAGINNTITIEYKQYGVSIGFTPTVFGDTINLAIAPEVSALDPANSIVLQGFRIPGITTRRAKTTIELRNGQSFAIAGLIRREFSDNMRGIPGASRLPIFGALLRSTGYQNNETEVVIIVTAHLAKPTDGRNLLAPTDVSQGPSEASLYLTGATERTGPAGQSSASLSAAMAARAPAALPAPVVSVPAPAPIVAVSAPPASSTPPPQIAAAPRPAAAPAPTLAMSAPAVRPAPQPTAVAVSAPAAKPAPAPQIAAALKPAAAPAPTLAMSVPAVRPAPQPTAVAVSAPAAKPASAPQVTAAPKPAAVPAPTLAWSAPAVRPVAPAPAATPNVTLSASALRPAQAYHAPAPPTVAMTVSTAKPAAAATAPKAGPATPSAVHQPSVTKAEPVTVDQVAMAKPAAASLTASKPTLTLNLTPISNPAAAPAVGR